MLQIFSRFSYSTFYLVFAEVLLNQPRNLFSCLVKNFVQIVRHGVLLAQIFTGALGGLGVGIQGSLVLFEKFLLYSYIMVSNTKNDHAVFGLPGLLEIFVLGIVIVSVIHIVKLVYQLILY
jgi:uncharacterized membrane protein